MTSSFRPCPVHQGRAAEYLIARAFVKPGDVAWLNDHFTTTKAHIAALLFRPHGAAGRLGADLARAFTTDFGENC